MSILWLILYTILAVGFIRWVLVETARQNESSATHGHAPDPAASDTPETSGDDLTRIKGVGAVISAKLRALGFDTIEKIANLEPADIEKINAELNFSGRIEREQWIQQAREIVAGR